ncbi:MAG: hypothetical protein QOF56_1052 [Acidobacteriaceae bacterium]|jgi:hypothetical protein|nr:hypothetical protein [Acidobacteriaceae bacterium]
MGTFYADVVAKDARFASSVSIGDPVLLEPMTRQLVERLVSAARQMGIEVMIYERIAARTASRSYSIAAPPNFEPSAFITTAWPATLSAQSAANLLERRLHLSGSARAERRIDLGR